MSRGRFEIPCGADPARAIERAVRHLVGEGYAVEKQSADRATLVYQAGSVAAALLQDHRHTLDLRCQNDKLLFDFHSVTGGSAHLGKRERAELKRRAQGAAKAAEDPPPPTPLTDNGDQFHCRYCARLTPASDPRCRHCGAENFN